MSNRDDLIKGLRDMADWLEANPAAPIEDFETAHIQHSYLFKAGEQKAAKEHMDALGDALGMDTGEVFGHYGFKTEFGPVRYLALAMKSKHGGRS